MSDPTPTRATIPMAHFPFLPMCVTASAERSSDGVFQCRERFVVFVNGVDSVDLCLLELAARRGDVEEGARSNAEAGFVQRQVFGRLVGDLRLKLDGLGLRDKREVRLSYGSCNLKVSGAYVIGRIVTVDALLLHLLLPLEPIENRERKEGRQAVRGLAELERLVAVADRPDLLFADRAAAARNGLEPRTDAERVLNHAIAERRSRLR